MPDVLAVVAGERVVRRVHAHRLTVMVGGKCWVLAQRLLQRLIGIATTGEQAAQNLTGAQARALWQRGVERAPAISHAVPPIPALREQPS